MSYVQDHKLKIRWKLLQSKADIPPNLFSSMMAKSQDLIKALAPAWPYLPHLVHDFINSLSSCHEVVKHYKSTKSALIRKLEKVWVARAEPLSRNPLS